MQCHPHFSYEEITKIPMLVICVMKWHNVYIQMLNASEYNGRNISQDKIKKEIL